IKNNPKSDYANVCSNKGAGMHGIEFRVFATRVGFEIFEKEERYQITFRVDVIIGFSYSEFTVKFGKEFNASGKYSEENGRLRLINRNEIFPLLLSISIGDKNNKFAIITDEMNNIVYNYGRNILANFEQKTSFIVTGTITFARDPTLKIT
uniref:Galectin n=1 Tax=Meloidogyne javanica TaxID=6303 RepID=A0A915MTB7_MELJA